METHAKQPVRLQTLRIVTAAASPLAAIPVFRDVEPETLALLASAATPRTLGPGMFLFHEYERIVPVCALLRGSVRVMHSARDGRDCVTAVLVAPTLVGDSEALSRMPAPTAVQAVEKCQVLAIDPILFRDAVMQSPPLTRHLLLAQAQRMQAASRAQRVLAFASVEVRLAWLLDLYVTAYGLPVAGGTKIRVPLQQEMLASACAINRRSVTRALSAWNGQGLVRKSGNSFVVSDVVALRALADEV